MSDAFKRPGILSPGQRDMLKDLSQTNLPTYVSSMTLKQREECMKFFLKIAQDLQATFDVESFFQLSIFTVSTANKSAPTIKDISVRSSKEATLSAWDSDYKGNASTILWRYIQECCQKTPFNAPRLYARYFSIVQSSGIGKSWLVDEVSKKISLSNCVYEIVELAFPRLIPIHCNIRDRHIYWMNQNIVQILVFKRS